jgi:ribonucleases P/MRP protein subunit RPP40
MVHGKKGFERIVRAFTDVLNQPLAWLFVDLDNHEIESGPIMKHHPQIKVAQQQIGHMSDVVVPIVYNKKIIADPLYEEQLLEWLGLVSIESPRVRQKDDIDRYLCRYDAPEAFMAEDQMDAVPQTVIHLRWHGFAAAKFIQGIWLVAKAAAGKHWFTLSASTFANESYTALCIGDRDVLLWECP